MSEAYICEAVRTPIGRFGGILSNIRTDDLAAIPLKAILDKHPNIKNNIDEVILGCANQAGEDNRNIARFSTLLAGFPVTTPGITVNRLCASGMDSVALAARMIKSNEAELIIAGGVESMSRAPLVIPKPTKAFSRNAEIYDTTIGWRFINNNFKNLYETHSMPETAQNVATLYKINRYDQDIFALRSQERYMKARKRRFFDNEIIPVQSSENPDLFIEHDEHPRNTTIEKLSNLPALFGKNSQITAGNSSGINDGAAALLIASSKAIKKYHLTPLARILCAASSGIEPSIMGVGPVSAIKKVLTLANLKLNDIDVFEINEAFAAQVLAITRSLGIADNADYLNMNGGAIAIGHPLGMSGSRLLATSIYALRENNLRYALCSMCVGVGQGTALILEKISD